MDKTIAALIGASRNGTAEPNPTSVLSVYEDDQMHRRADEACRTIANGASHGHQTWWRLQDLREPAVLAGAAHMAMRADVIIISLECSEGLPLPFYVWINSWLPHRKRFGGKLVLLLGNTSADAWHAEHACAYLRQAAAQVEMEFTVQGGATPAAPCRVNGKSHARARHSRVATHQLN